MDREQFLGSSHGSIRSEASASTWPPSTHPAESLTSPQTGISSTNSEQPGTSESAHQHSMATESSTAPPSIRSSLYSQATEQTPFLPSSSQVPHLTLQQTGEQIWVSSSDAPGGQRTESKHQRGCVMPRASLYDQSNWKRVVQDIIGYDFRDVDLLEEALESVGSGVPTVGKSHRNTSGGNIDLAIVGESTMTLVLRDQCYLFRIAKNDADNFIERMIGMQNLYQLGMNTKLQQYIRPRKPIQASKRNNFFGLLAEDAKATAAGANPVRAVATGIRAIIGAVYYDGGYDSARRVMAHFRLTIKLPEPKPAPIPPDYGRSMKYA